jgi:hypothetical protein
MADDPSKRGPQDRSRINVNEPWERRWWCKQLRVTSDELKAVVQKVGPMASSVRGYLGSRRISR